MAGLHCKINDSISQRCQKINFSSNPEKGHCGVFQQGNEDHTHVVKLLSFIAAHLMKKKKGGKERKESNAF